MCGRMCWAVTCVSSGNNWAAVIVLTDCVVGQHTIDRVYRCIRQSCEAAASLLQCNWQLRNAVLHVHTASASVQPLQACQLVLA